MFCLCWIRCTFFFINSNQRIVSCPSDLGKKSQQWKYQIYKIRKILFSSQKKKTLSLVVNMKWPSVWCCVATLQSDEDLVVFVVGSSQLENVNTVCPSFCLQTNCSFTLPVKIYPTQLHTSPTRLSDLPDRTHCDIYTCYEETWNGKFPFMFQQTYSAHQVSGLWTQENYFPQNVDDSFKLTQT